MITTSATVWSFLIAAVISGTVHLVAEYRGPDWLLFSSKPLTTALLVCAAAVAPAAEPRYRLFIVIGLLFSLAGDVFLMLPADRFIAGLMSFLIAHVFYIRAFTTSAPFGARPLLLIPWLAVAFTALAILWPGLGRLRIPVVVYVAALVAMAWQASVRASLVPSPSAIAAAVGAALFVISDATLAIDRFRLRFRAAQLVIMSSYVMAQALIASSVSASQP